MSLVTQPVPALACGYFFATSIGTPTGIDAMLPDQQNLICPVRISCSASFTASAGFQVGSAATQHQVASTSTRKDKIFMCDNEIRYRQRTRGFFDARDIIPQRLLLFLEHVLLPDIGSLH